jgi:hypothetical protein
MKTSLIALAAAAILSISACSQSQNNNEAASDTSSILDTNRLNSATDTSAVNDVKGTDSAGRPMEAEHEESTGKQATRTNVGSDTTGKQEHDNNPK